MFNKIITLSKQIAASLIKNEYPISLDKTDLFNEEDKKHIFKNLTDKISIKERQDLKNSINTQADWQKVKPKRKSKVRKLYWQYAAAAAVIGIISTTFFFKDNLFKNINDKPIISNAPIQSGTDKATLTLEDGETITLAKGTKYQTASASSNGEKIIYQEATKNKQPTNNNQIAYNYLTVPRGGQFQITLSDGTKVWLNSESQLKYPVSFADGKTRKVELVYGEAYFDVSPSTNHKGAKFEVINKDQNIEVLGTEFNVKAYKDETNIYTTLVEGKVAISYKDQKENLTPNQQAKYNLKTNKFKINTVEVYNEISWKDGIFSFEDKPLKEMMKVLSRWYDVEVEFKNKEAEKEEFIGVLRKEQNLNNILETIKNFGIIKEYTINNKKITIQ
tara:strand:- start:159 stop:1328 length:1170 start_codon:yes stop_codon:yes gene_type:complete